MKPILTILTILIILTLTSPALADDWDTVDKTLLGVLITSKVVNCLQTQYIFDTPEYIELNSVINDGVNRYGEGFIPAYFAVTTLVAGLIADWLPSDYRKIWLGLWVGTSIMTIEQNYSIGIKLQF